MSTPPMKQNVSVLLVDDHDLVRGGFRALLNTIDGIEVVGEAENGVEALQQVEETNPDIVLSDIGMQPMNGLELVSALKDSHTSVRTIMLSMHEDEQYVQRALVNGASGYLLKDSDCSELLVAIQAVMDDQVYLSPSISLNRANESCAQHEQDANLECLTARQKEVLKLITNGNSTKQIALQLSLSPKTVETHRSQLMRKLNIFDVAGLVKFAIRSGLCSSQS